MNRRPRWPPSSVVGRSRHALAARTSHSRRHTAVEMRPKPWVSQARLAQAAAPSRTGLHGESGNAAPDGAAGTRIDFISTAVQ